MLELNIIQKIVIWILPLLFAITLHEAGHAWAANKLGDTTAKMLGRLSLNPVKHIDPFGTIAVPLLMAVMTQFQFIFGWAKPVPISTRNLKHPRRDSALVALAGPAANFLMMLLWASIMKLALFSGPQTNKIILFLFLSGQAGIMINVMLLVLNLLPIPPLDGSKLLYCLLPARLSYHVMNYEAYGMIIVLLLMVTGLLRIIIMPPIDYLLYFIKVIFSI